MRVLWLVTARSGSKGIPGKNVKKLGGLPLLAWRVLAARRAGLPGDIWISTDSPAYAKVAARYGARVPFLRPAALARDDSPSAAVCAHALEFAAAAGERFDLLGLLEPTSPFVLPRTLAAAARALDGDPRAGAAVATRVARPPTLCVQPRARYLSILCRQLERARAGCRQEQPVEITPSGGFYLAKPAAFARRGSFYTPRTLSWEVSELEGLEIDEPIDWEWAEFLLARGKIDLRSLIGRKP